MESYTSCNPTTMPNDKAHRLLLAIRWSRLEDEGRDVFHNYHNENLIKGQVDKILRDVVQNCQFFLMHFSFLIAIEMGKVPIPAIPVASNMIPCYLFSYSPSSHTSLYMGFLPPILSGKQLHLPTHPEFHSVRENS